MIVNIIATTRNILAFEEGSATVSQDDLFGAPAGWYPDPLGLPQLRWWNNHAWTEQTSAARQPMVVQDTKFAWADDELPTRRDERLRERGQDRRPADTVAPTAEALRELEPPRAFSQFNQAAQTTQAAPPAAPVAPAAAAPAEPIVPVAAQAPVAPPTPIFTPEPEPVAPVATRVDSLYTPDPVVESPFVETPFSESLNTAFADPTFADPAAFTEAPAASPSLDTIFDARPMMTTPAGALDAIFGENEARRSGTRVKTPVVTLEHVATAASSARQSSTGAAYVMAIIPIAQLVISLLLLTSLGMSGSQFIYIAILVVPYFIAIALAYFDNAALKKAGHTELPHWAWAALTVPVYLILRARVLIRETGHGISPVLVWLGNSVLQLASVLAVPGVLIALLPSVFIAQLEDSVASDAMLMAGANMTVSCPISMPPVLPGERVKCQTTSSNGTVQDIVVTLQRSNGWISWWVIDWGDANAN